MSFNFLDWIMSARKQSMASKPSRHGRVKGTLAVRVLRSLAGKLPTRKQRKALR